MDDDAGGGARLMLRSGTETRHQIVDLNQTQRYEGHGFNVNTAPQRCRECVLRRCGRKSRGAERFMRAANQRMDEGRNRSWKMELRTKQVGIYVEGRTLNCSIVAAEICRHPKQLEGIECAGGFPAIQIRMRL